MSRRIVLYGASGYTGRLVAEALVRARIRPVLAGRSHQNLSALGVVLGKGLDIAVAHPAVPESLLGIVETGNILVNTAGPFARIGRPVLEAAIIKGAAYIDCCAEPSFIRTVYGEYQDHVDEARIPVITAAGYEFAAGDVAATLAVEPVKERAVRVDVGYFFLGPRRGSFTPGTLASAGNEALGIHHAWRDGNLMEVKAAERSRLFDVNGGGRRPGVSVGGAEHVWIPRRFPGIQEVNVYLGWGRSERAAKLAGRVVAGAARAPGIPALVSRVTSRPRTSPGPTPQRRNETGCMVTATACAEDGEELHTVTLRGANPYAVTAELLAWEALALQGDWSVAGVRSPVDVFGLDRLQDALALAGLLLADER